MFRTRLALVLATLVPLALACSDVTGPVDTPLPPSSQPTVPAFPATTGPAAIYVEQNSLYPPYSTRFVLYENGAFALQFPSSGLPLEFAGAYTRTDSLVTFEWRSSRAWGATGILRGDELVVRYNVLMQMTDFVDGTYVRSRGAP